MSQQIDTRIYNQARKLGINDTLARLIVAQARHETGDYTSRLFRTSNNLFGYKFVGQTKWPTGASTIKPPANEGATPYAAYATLENSVGELVDWLKRRQRAGLFTLANITTSQLFADSLKRGGYYGDTVSNYKRGLDSAMKKIIIGASALGTLAIILGIFFFS